MQKLKISYKLVKYYKPNASKQGKESKVDFINRVRSESLVRQIVKVGDQKVIFGIEGPIILNKGKFWSVSAEVENGYWGKHHILIFPSLKDILSRNSCFIRLDSGCFSGMVLGDLTCDCCNQLRYSQNFILKRGGVIIEIPAHDGRGWQDFKMANQRIMEECKMDTITTATSFYGDVENIDCRTYSEAALILKALGFPNGYQFDLGTKNPSKIISLVDAGFAVAAKAVEVENLSNATKKNLQAKYKYWHINKKEGKQHAIH